MIVNRERLLAKKSKEIGDIWAAGDTRGQELPGRETFLSPNT